MDESKWVVLHENATMEHELLPQPLRPLIMAFGSMLCACSVLGNSALMAALLRRPLTSGSRAVVLTHGASAAATSSLLVPLLLHTERLKTWAYGPVFCRVWLLAQVWLSALAVWSALAAVTERVVYVASPRRYAGRMGCGLSVALSLTPWLVCSLITTPAAVRVFRSGDVVLDEVCALHLSPLYASGMASAIFFVPAFAMTVTCTVAVCRRAPKPACASAAVGRDPSYANFSDVGTGSTFSGSAFNESTFSDGGTISSSASTPRDVRGDEEKHVRLAKILALLMTVICVAFWSPFQVLNVYVTGCSGFCISHSSWVWAQWCGVAVSSLLPLLWFLHPEVRFPLARKTSGYAYRMTSGRDADAASETPKLLINSNFM